MKTQLLTLQVLHIKKYGLSFEVNHLTNAPGTTSAQKNIILLEKVIPNTLPFLGMAEENQRDSVIYGGHLEL